MNKNNEFTGRKTLCITIMVWFASFLALVNILNYKTFVINYNNQTYAVRAVSSISTEQLFAMADLDYTLIENSEIVEVDDKLTEISIYNPFTVNVAVDGQVHTLKTNPTTVFDVLTELEITLKEDDIISQDLKQLLTSNTNIGITRVTYEQTMETEYLDFQTIRRESASLNYGTTKVQTEGERGEKVITTETILYDGDVIADYIVSEEILKEPVNHIVEYGSFNVNRGVTARDGVITTASGQMLSYSKVIQVEATAYSTENWSSKMTKSGTLARVGAIAVDPRVIPLGTKLYITSTDGKSWIYGVATAEDTGSAIVGNKIDLFFNTQKECISFGRQQATVYVLS